jgi:hypothetical protein
MDNAHHRFFQFHVLFCINNARVIDGKIRYMRMHQFKPPSKAKLVSSHPVIDYNTHVTCTLNSYQNVSFSIPRYLTAMWESCCTSVQKQETFWHNYESCSRLTFLSQVMEKSLWCYRWHNKTVGSCSKSSSSLSGTNDTTIDINLHRKMVME